MALRSKDGGRTREEDSSLGPSLAEARVRLEGRLELLEAATTRYRRLVREVRRVGWHARVRNELELFREAAWLEPEVISALATLQARAVNEGWPHNGGALEVGRVCNRERAALEQLLEKRQRGWNLSGLTLTGRLAATVARLGEVRPGLEATPVPLGVLERQGPISVLTRAEGSPAVILGLLAPLLPWLPRVPGALVNAFMETVERGSRLLNWAAGIWRFPTFRAQIRFHRESRLLAMSLGLERAWLQQLFRIPADARVWVRDETGPSGLRVLSVAVGPVELVRDSARADLGPRMPELILGGFSGTGSDAAARAAEQIAAELALELAPPPELEPALPGKTPSSERPPLLPDASATAPP